MIDAYEIYMKKIRELTIENETLKSKNVLLEAGNKETNKANEELGQAYKDIQVLNKKLRRAIENNELGTGIEKLKEQNTYLANQVEKYKSDVVGKERQIDQKNKSIQAFAGVAAISDNRNSNMRKENQRLREIIKYLSALI